MNPGVRPFVSRAAMIAAERPPPFHVVAEFARLAALRSYHVLDAPPVEGLEALVHAAAGCFGGSAAAVAFVDQDRVCFGPAVGLDLRVTTRAGSFWHHAMGQPGAMVVPDALGDVRFHDHPVVQGAEALRFYAGVPLQDGDGYQLGTLCALDRRTGDADPSMLNRLTEIGSEVMARLSAHRDELASYAGEPELPLPMPPIPVPLVAAMAPGMVQTWLGVRTKRADHSLAANRPGLIVLSVAADSPAYRAALRPTDVLMSIDGTSLYRPSDVTSVLANRRPGGTAMLRLVRAGHMLERELQLEPAPPRKAPARQGF